MDYQNALSTLAEVAIAITGFAGVVAVFGRLVPLDHAPIPDRHILIDFIIFFIVLVFLHKPAVNRGGCRGICNRYELLLVDFAFDLEADVRVAGDIGDPALLVRVFGVHI